MSSEIQWTILEWDMEQWAIAENAYRENTGVVAPTTIKGAETITRWWRQNRATNPLTTTVLYGVTLPPIHSDSLLWAARLFSNITCYANIGGDVL